MEEWVLGRVVRSWDQREDVENDEKYDEMCWKCCDVGRENIEPCSNFSRRYTGMSAITRPMNDIIVRAVETTN